MMGPPPQIPPQIPPQMTQQPQYPRPQQLPIPPDLARQMHGQPPEVQKRLYHEYALRVVARANEQQQFNRMLLAQSLGQAGGVPASNGQIMPGGVLQGRAIVTTGLYPQQYQQQIQQQRPSEQDRNIATIQFLLHQQQQQQAAMQAAAALTAGRPLPGIVRPQVPAVPGIGSRKQADDIIREMAIVGSLDDIEMDPPNWEDVSEYNIVT